MGCPRLRRTSPDAPRRFILVVVQLDGLMPWNERVGGSPTSSGVTRERRERPDRCRQRPSVGKGLKQDTSSGVHGTTNANGSSWSMTVVNDTGDVPVFNGGSLNRVSHTSRPRVPSARRSWNHFVPVALILTSAGLFLGFGLHEARPVDTMR